MARASFFEGIPRPISAGFEHSLNLQERGIDFGTTVAEGMSIRIDSEETDETIQYFHRMAAGMISKGPGVVDWDSYAWRMIEILIDLALPQLADPLYRPAFYLPADRTGLMHAHRVVVGSLFDRASKPGLRRTDPLPDLSGIVADFLKQLIELGDLAERRVNRVDALA